MSNIDFSKVITSQQKELELKNQLVDNYKVHIEDFIESVAKSRNYTNSVSLASYTTSSVPSWQAESKAFVFWRDLVWVYVLEKLAEYTVDPSKTPPIETFLQTLPTIDWEMFANQE